MGACYTRNDDIVSGNTNSEIRETLSAGTYTIEVTTYDSGATGDFHAYRERPACCC